MSSPSNTGVLLPEATQVWMHNVCTPEALTSALEAAHITAIETDILLGRLSAAVDALDPDAALPILAHPPRRESLVSFEAFLDRVVGRQRHIKLDFKEMAVVEPCLQLVARHLQALDASGQCVWLNADVVPGPGYGAANADVPVLDADAFVTLCQRYCPRMPMSLGWKTRTMCGQPYTLQHARSMSSLLHRHNVDCCVIAASVRIAAIDPEPLCAFLKQHPQCQLLLWSGTGEPPIRPTAVDAMLDLFHAHGLRDRVGLDANISTSFRSWTGDIATAVVRLIEATLGPQYAPW